MKAYETYTAEELACDDDFLKWVKYPQHHPDLDLFWKQWLLEHPEKQETADEARALLLAVLEDDQFTPGPSRQQDVWDRIRVSAELEPSRKFIPLWRGWLSRAAVLAIFLSTVWWAYTSMEGKVTGQVQKPAKAHFIHHVNNSNSPQTIMLADGTSILLQAGSVLKYPQTFAADSRRVSLTGEAFFEVARETDRPFLVESGEIITRVLGTSFKIRNVEGEDKVLVQVKTGKVSVFRADERSGSSLLSNTDVPGVVLMPNQQVLYEKNAMTLTKSLVDNPSVLALPRRQNFEFADAPIKEVFQAIEEAYGVEVLFDEEAMATCYLNASLDGVPLKDKLRLICKAVNGTFEIMDSHIIVYSKGCQEAN